MLKRRLSVFIIILMLIAQYTYGLGVPQTARAEGSVGSSSVTEDVYGSNATVTQSVYKIENDMDILTGVALSVIGSDGQPTTGPIYDQGSNVTLDYTWALPNGHGYKSGDTFTFKLPAEFKLYNDISGILASDAGNVGTFKISQATHEVVMTFSSFIQDHDNVHGTLRVNTQFDQQVIVGNTVQQILIPINGDTQTFTFNFRPLGATVEKSGASQGFNAERIQWTIDVNKSLDTVENAVVTDTVPAGLSLGDLEGNLSVYQLNVALDGSATRGDMIERSNYTAELAGETLTVRFNASINSAYRVEFATTIVDESKAEFTNKAVFSGDNRSPVESTATVIVKRGGSFNKFVTDYQWGKQIISWAIEYNYNEKNIAEGNAILTDLFNDSQELLEGTLKVYPVTLDSAGTATKGTALTEGTDYTLTNASGTNQAGFKLQFLKDISSAYRLEYQTKAKDRVVSNTTITNKVFNGTDSDTATQVIRPTVIYKNLSGVNYQNKTAAWKVTINGDNYSMDQVKVKDIFPSGGLKYIPGTLVVKNALGKIVDPSEYDLSPGTAEVNKGFEISFHSQIVGTHTISYTVEFNNEWITTSTEQFNNTARIEWVDDSLLKHSAEAKGVFNPRSEVKNNGFKSGSYNAVTKEITWKVGVNYNGKSLSNAVVTDLVRAPQSLIEDSLQVYKMNIAVNGTPAQGEEITDFTFDTSETDNGTLLNVRLGAINSAYYIIFKTDLEGKLLGTKVDNKANLFDGNVPASKDLKASVSIPYGGEHLTKDGQQIGDKIQWTVPVNRGQSYIKNAKITDTPSSNQILLPDSFHLHPTTVSADGAVVVSGNELVKDTDYTLEFTSNGGQQSFVVSFKTDIKSAYILTYQSLIAANHGEQVTNTAKLTGDNEIEVNKETTKIMVVGISSGSGTGSGERSTLTVKKVDADDNSVLLSGATFRLYRISGTERLLVDTQSTQPNGIATFSNILAGNYVVAELAAPVGYVLDSQDRTVSLSPGAAVELLVTNKKQAVATPTPDTSGPTPDTTVPTPDTSGPTPDTTVPTPDTTVPTPDTSGPTPDTTVPTPDTSGPTPDTTVPTPDTSVPVPTPSTIPGEIIIVDTDVPAGPGGSTNGQPSPPADQESPIDQELPDDEVPLGGTDIDDEEIPYGSMPDNSAVSPEVQQLPKTGEDSSLPLYIAGAVLILVGFVLNKRFKRVKE